MSEVEKMYELAGIEQEYFEHFHGDGYDYPPFTAEKQLELIKWCIDNYRGEIFDTIETEWFEEQLSAYINNLWQDLTEIERNEIRRILNE